MAAVYGVVDLFGGELEDGAGKILGKIGGKDGLKWLQGAGSLEREQLVKDIEDAGFKRMSPKKSPIEVFEKGDTKIRLDPSQKGTPYNHMHIEHKGDSYSKELKKVHYRSKDAHIPIQ